MNPLDKVYELLEIANSPKYFADEIHVANGNSQNLIFKAVYDKVYIFTTTTKVKGINECSPVLKRIISDNPEIFSMIDSIYTKNERVIIVSKDFFPEDTIISTLKFNEQLIQLFQLYVKHKEAN